MAKKNKKQEAQHLAVVLLALITGGQRKKAAARIAALSMAEAVAVMRAYQELEDMVCDTAEKWNKAIYWGRGVDFPDADEEKKRREKVRARVDDAHKATHKRAGKAYSKSFDKAFKAAARG